MALDNFWDIGLAMINSVKFKRDLEYTLDMMIFCKAYVNILM